MGMGLEAPGSQCECCRPRKWNEQGGKGHRCHARRWRLSLEPRSNGRHGSNRYLVRAQLSRPKNPLLKRDPKAQAVITKTVAKARSQTNTTLLQKIAESKQGAGWRFREDPPILTRVDDKTREKVIQGREEYAPQLSPERLSLIHI